MVKALAPPLKKGAPTGVYLTLERSLLFESNVKRKKGAYLLIRKKGFSFILGEVSGEVSNDISLFVF